VAHLRLGQSSDYLGDQDAIEFMCNEAIDAVLELEHMGCRLTVLPRGASCSATSAVIPITSRQTRCGAPATLLIRTGHMILQTLYYQQCLEETRSISSHEYQVLDFLIRPTEKDRRRGCWLNWLPVNCILSMPRP